MSPTSSGSPTQSLVTQSNEELLFNINRIQLELERRAQFKSQNQANSTHYHGSQMHAPFVGTPSSSSPPVQQSRTAVNVPAPPVIPQESLSRSISVIEGVDDKKNLRKKEGVNQEGLLTQHSISKTDKIVLSNQLQLGRA
jgi:hypothetical protein